MEVNLRKVQHRPAMHLSTNCTHQQPRVFFRARTRILTWYTLLLASSTLVALLAVRPLLFISVEKRVEGSLVQEREEFRRLAKGLNPATGQPFGENVTAIFDVFLSRNIPDDDEFLLTLIEGQFYKSSPTALPDGLNRDSDLVNHLAQLTQPEQGKKVLPDDTILYLAEPLRIGGEVRGMFVVAHLTTGEREEVDEAFVTILQATIAGWVMASVLAWFAAGNVLAPLRTFTETARSVSESDLSQRILVHGSGEIAELAITFNEMMDRLQSAFTSQRNFINDAGHELRTPITIIRGHLELMGDDPEEQQETLALVFDELDRMNRFVNDLILLAKAERLDFLQPETVDVGSLTETLYAKARTLADRDWHLDAQGKGQIVADRQRITQAIVNLAQNATQHTTHGNQISLGSAIDKGKVRFWVCDTGEGIAPADQQRIFKRFARAANSRRRSEGAGLGLAIVQAIAEAHGGSVELFSQPGVGSKFTIVLPLEPPQEVLSHASDSDR